MGAKPPGAVRPQGGRRPPSMGWAEGPITVPRQLGLGSEGPVSAERVAVTLHRND